MSFRPENVFVGLDADGRARFAMSAAVALAVRFGAPCRPLHAIALPRFTAHGDVPAVEAALRERARQTLGLCYADDPAQRAAAAACSIETGHPAQCLADAAGPYDLICIGPHAARGRIDFGSTTRALLAESGTPIWTQPHAPRPIRSILAPVDLGPGSARILDAAAVVASRFGATVRAAYWFAPPDILRANRSGEADGPMMARVWDQEESSFRRLVGDVDWRGVEHSDTFVEGLAEEAILAAEKDHDLIVMGSHGRTGLWRFVLGNVAYVVLRSANVPALVLPTPEEKA